MHPLQQLLDGVEHLFFPWHCAGCGSDMLDRDQHLCARCIAALPHTGYTALTGNPIEKMFWGRLKLEAATSTFYFSKSTLVQQLIHQLKYKGNRGIGHYLGNIMGHCLQTSNRFADIDGVVPLPMHPVKERKRGYNQAALLCEGIASVTGAPVLKDVLLKPKVTETQTRKHRTERWENAEGSFAVYPAGMQQRRHLLLVDDVITTGATLEAAGQCLLKTGGIKLSIATLATALK
jgi:ComF family protein